MTKSTILLYQVRPIYDYWFKLIVGGTLSISLIPGIALLYTYVEIAWTLLGITLFDGLLFSAIIRRRFQLFEDRLKIVLGRPFALNVPYGVIIEVRTASPDITFVYWDLRLATSTRNLLEIVKNKGLNIVISPSDKDMFLEQLNQACNALPDTNKEIQTVTRKPTKSAL